MFPLPAWAVGSYSSGPPAGGSPQISVNPTKVLDHQSRPVLFFRPFWVFFDPLCGRHLWKPPNDTDRTISKLTELSLPPSALPRLRRHQPRDDPVQQVRRPPQGTIPMTLFGFNDPL